MFVVTADQQGSRTRGDRVPEALAALARPGLPSLRRAFERTTGDEIQGVLGDAAGVVATVSRLTRLGGWRVGVGIGGVDEPLPPSTREGSGPAFVAARRAVERARRDALPVAIDAVGADGVRAGDAETALLLLASVLGRRSVRGWEAIDLMDAGATGAEAAARLGISASAVSQRRRSAEADLGERAHALAAHLMDEIAT